MKLIELLVQELPKRGGWPDGAYVCFVNSRENDKAYFHAVNGRFVESEPVNTSVVDLKNGEIQYVTREQYEAALAAAQQPVWSGEGLPPVGCECEWQDKNSKQWIKVSIVYASEWVTVIREDKIADPVEIAIENYGDEARRKFRPIRSEADKKRDEAGEAIYRAINWNHEGAVARNSRFEDYCKAYDAIRGGQVPGVTIK